MRSFVHRSKAEKTDFIEIQHDISKCLARCIIIENFAIAIESDYPPIKHVVYHQFVTP